MLRSAFEKRAESKPLTLTNSAFVVVLAMLALLGLVVWISQLRLLE